MVADAEDKFTDLAWHRCWVNNPDMDLTFLEGELEKTLAIWKARLKEEDEIMSRSEAISKDDYVDEVSSKVAPRSSATLEAEIDALLGEGAVEEGMSLTEEHRAANTTTARQETIQLVRETFTEAEPSNQDPSPQP